MRPWASPRHVHLQAEAGTPLEGTAEETEAERVDAVPTEAGCRERARGALSRLSWRNIGVERGGLYLVVVLGRTDLSVRCRMSKGGDLVAGHEEEQEESVQVAVQQGTEMASEHRAELALHEGAESSNGEPC